MIADGRFHGYTAYGVGDGLSCSHLAFCGERRDPLSGSYHLGNGRRTYNPILMRLHSADAFSPFGRGGINAYAYCSGDPINRVDRNGAFSIANLLYSVGAAEGLLNILEGLTTTLKNVVQARMRGTRLTLKDQTKSFLKFHKGNAKIVASTLVIYEQGGPAVAAIVGSGIADATGKVLSTGERLIGIYQDVKTVVSYGKSNPAQAASVAMETVGILSGASLVKEGISKGVGFIRGKDDASS